MLVKLVCNAMVDKQNSSMFAPAITVSILTSLAWATAGIFVKSLGEISPFFIIWSRLFLATFLIYILGRHSVSIHHILSFERGQRISWLCASLMTGYYTLTTGAFLLAPVSLIALAISLSPVFIILARLVEREKVLGREILGCAVALLGLAIFLFYVNDDLTLDNQYSLLLGLGLGIIAGALKAFYSLILWKMNNYPHVNLGDSYSLTFKTFFIGSIIFLPFAIHTVPNFDFSLKVFLLLVGLGMLSTAIPTLMNSYASKRVNPTAHTMISLSVPMLASILAFLFLGERISIVQVFGIGVTLFGIIITIKPLSLST